MPAVLVRCACTNNAKFAFQHDKPDVSVKEFTKILLVQYENYRKRLGQKVPVSDVIHLVDGCGCAVLDDVDMSVYLSAGAATFGLVLRDDMERLALQHDTQVNDMLQNLCFDKDKTCFFFSDGIFKRPDTKKRASPELSDAPTEMRKDNKRNKGPVKDMVRDIIKKGLCLESDIPGRDRLFKLPHDAGLKVLEAFKELMCKNTGAEKRQLFIQSLEPFSPSNPPRGSASPTKPFTITDSAEDTAGGKKRKQDEQEAKKAAPAPAEAVVASNKKPKTADATDKLQLAASGKTLSAPATPAGSKDASSDNKDKKAAAKKEQEPKKKKEEERLAKEQEKEEKERLKKQKAAKEKEEKERLKQEKAETAAKEKERLKNEKADKAAKEKEEKERLKKEKEKETQETERKKTEEEAAKAKAKEDKKAAAAAKAKELAAAAVAAAAAAEKAARDAEASDADEEDREEDKQEKGVAKSAAADSESEEESGGEETEEESSSDEDEKEEKPKAEKRASEPAKKDAAVKMKSLQEEKAKLEAQLRLKKSPAATPASKAGTVGAPGKALAYAGDKWHDDVKAQMATLEKTGKLKEADLDQGALKALKTLPYEVALVCLNKILNETSAIRNMNAFIVKNCTHLRNQWGVDDAASSSSDDDASDDDESEEEQEGVRKAKAVAPAAVKAAPKVVDVKPVADSDSEDDEDATEASGGKSVDAGDTDSDASDEEQSDPLKALVASGSKGKPSPVTTRNTSQTGGGPGRAKATAKGKGHQSFEAKAVTADSVSSAFACADAEGSVASGRSGASKASGRNTRASKAS